MKGLLPQSLTGRLMAALVMVIILINLTSLLFYYLFRDEAAMLGAEGLRRRHANQSLRDVLRAPASWTGLQQPIVLDRFGDSDSRFHLSEVRDGRFVMIPS